MEADRPPKTRSANSSRSRISFASTTVCRKTIALCQKMLMSTIKRNKNNWTIGAKSLAGPVRGYNRQDFLATWAEHFDQPEETNCTDPTSGTGTSDGTAEVQCFHGLRVICTVYRFVCRFEVTRQ